MQHDLFSSLDSLLSAPAGAGGFLVRDPAGLYRPAEADEVLLAAQRLRVQPDFDADCCELAEKYEVCMT